jgi:hypothetical protein
MTKTRGSDSASRVPQLPAGEFGCITLDLSLVLESEMKQRIVNAPLLRCPLRISTGVAVILFVGSAGIASVPLEGLGDPASTQEEDKTAAVPKDSVEPLYSVVSPLGDCTARMITMAPRLDTLDGKTVGLVWNHAFKADITLPAIGESLKHQYPRITIIPYSEIDAAIRAAARARSLTEAEVLQAVFKEKGFDAVISGNGG